MNENLPVSQFIEFDLNAVELWDLISTPGNLNYAHPYCLSNEIISWDSNGHSDRIIYLNGRNYVRKFNLWEEKQGFTLQIGEENGPQSFVKWEISTISANKTVLKITVYPYILSKFPRPFRKILHKFWVQPRLKKYLNSVLLGFLYYSENGISVPKNHFGKHPWFS
tara:strand:+ start:311 stop:808 length:498 start_codon:yes stop_codon:yes gene_type:complete